MKLKVWELALIAALIFSIGFGILLSKDAQALSDKLIRLHVVANSDSDSDQELKLQVRDAVLDELEPLLRGAGNSEEAQNIIEDNSARIESAALKSINDAGYDYSVEVTMCQESFPTTEYDTFSLPAGVYDSLRIIIGEGKGHNWWCVVFPPVCSAPVLDQTTADAVGLTGDEVALITEDSGGYMVKFKLIELIGKLKTMLFG